MVADDEVGTVVKAGITVAAEAEFVLVTLHHSLLVSQFDTRSVAGAADNKGSNCRSSSGSSHRSSGVSEALAGSTLCVKVFHFLDARRHMLDRHPTPAVIIMRSSSRGHPDRVIQTRVIQTGSYRQGHPDKGLHMSKNRQRLYFVFILCYSCHQFLVRNRRTRYGGAWYQLILEKQSLHTMRTYVGYLQMMKSARSSIPVSHLWHRPNLCCSLFASRWS